MHTASPAAHGTAATPQAPPPATPAVPERPRLAPGVKPAGQMQESAFKNPPWLIEREESGYVQVTQLLYRIAEHCTGENTVDDIAAKITAAGEPVNPETVRRLLLQLLIPRGLVAAADGSVVTVDNSARSVLALNMRMKVISPRLIDPVTRVLQVLYWPPILIGVLVLAVLAHGWLYFVHGVAGSVRDTLYRPGFMFLVLAAVVLSAAYHELGHAAALRYAGGRVKAMGAGFYLVYPAFYTDVSDNYRLRRWPRVRTDLGGFYFNLIFALGVMALYAVTGREFLLLIVLLLAFEMIYQLMPFVRLDGYWTLADLTGIPDFFSQMGAFWRSVLPIPRWQGTRLPELKWWAKVIFALYTLITIPLLTLFFFLMIRGVPRVLATTWDSFRKLASESATAWADGSTMGVAAGVLQMIILALPTFGMLFVLFMLARRVLSALWKWSRPSAPRRVAGAFGTAAIVALVALLWLPQLPAMVPRAGGQPGLLYRQASFRPIAPGERGAVGDVARDVPLVGASAGGVAATTTPAPTTTATSSPSPTAAASATRTPVAAVSPVPRVTTTAVPTARATILPTAQATPRPTATPAAP